MTLSGRVEHALPPARLIELAQRGSSAVWDSASWTDAPSNIGLPLVLLHGWNVDARLNFDSAFGPLADGRRVIMFDQHGHGAGPRTTKRFDLDECALDTVRILDALDIERAVVVGYSLGGAVAQVFARRRPDRCAGLVLAATADRYAEGRREHAQFVGLGAGAKALRRLPTPIRQSAFRRISAAACRRYPEWVLDTVRAADPIALLEAGAALGAFDSSTWSNEIASPSAVVVTARDTVVPPDRQRRLARALAAEHVFEIDTDHDIPIRNDPRFADALVAAVEAVTAQ